MSDQGNSGNPNGSQINQDTSASINVGGMAKSGAQAVANKATENVKKKFGEKIRNWAAKKLGKESLKTTAKLSLSGPLAALLFKVFIILVCIILLIGIVMFIITMPGMLMDKLKNLAKNVANAWLAWWGGDTSKQIDEEQIYEILDYIADMGFDLKGYGFLTDHVHNSEELDGFFERTGKDEGDYEDRANQETDGDPIFDEDYGVVRNGASNEIILAASDFVNAYLTSENYLYTIKNFNLNDVGAWDAFCDRFGSLFGDNMDNRTGMLYLVHEGAGGIGTSLNSSGEDDAYDASELGYIEADAEAKILEVKKGWANGKMKFSLDGWTGRYGMPLDFLVSIHTATFMPDLAYDMTQQFETEIRIILHGSSGAVVGQYKNHEGTYITYEEICNAVNGVSGRNWWEEFVAWVDGWNLSKEEADILFNMGIIPEGHNPPECNCEYEVNKTIDLGYGPISVNEEVVSEATETEEAVIKYTYEWWDPVLGIFIDKEVENPDDIKEEMVLTELGGNCKDYLNYVIEHTHNANAYSFETYTPYIENVTDHWYRDVYFVRRAGSNTGFVDYDYDYEALMKERWTLYEKYTADESEKDSYKYNPERAGEEILLVIDEDGKYKEEGGKYVVFDGTIEDANPSEIYEKNGSEYTKTDKSLEDAQEAGITLYRKSSKGGYVEYTGDVAVSKKAVTVDISENYEDLSWHKLSDGSYSAYSPEENKISDMQKPLKPGVEEYDEAGDFERLVMDRVFAEVAIGVVTQTGEGQRTETNPKIKKMFLQNNYFRYDGNAETALIITELRNKIHEDRKADDPSAEKYGPLTEDEMKKEYKISYGYEENRKEDEVVKVRDYAGRLEVLTQDALNAFSMLENTHTLDADYIYRDFKELIVELGYFEKEELTDETPRLLQFPIPDIGSAEYPARSIDKRVQEKGTMIHSKYDIETNKEYINIEIAESMVGDLDNEASEATETPVENSQSAVSGIESEVTRVVNNRLSLSANPIANTQEVGAVGGEVLKTARQVPLKEFLKATREMCEYINTVGYDYCVICEPGNDGNGDTCTCSDECVAQYATSGKCAKLTTKTCPCTANHCKHSIHKNECDLAPDFESSKAPGRNNFCCDRLVKWALQNVGLIAKNGGAGGAKNLGDYIMNELGAERYPASEPLKEGDIVYSSGHIEIVGEKKNGGFVQYNGGHEVPIGATEGNDGSSIGFITQPFSGAEYILRLPWGKSEDALYEGYEGNEAVVSPVTGVLIDYGTYNRDEDQKRENVDLKYGPSVKITLDEETGEIKDVELPGETLPEGTGTDETTEENYEPVYDEVGYAVIRVMTKEDFEHLESNINSYWSNLGDKEGLLDSSGVFRDKITKESELEDLLDPTKTSNGLLAETIYGYKEFAEMYSTYGIYVNSESNEDGEENPEPVRKLISGYTIFIDGFKCELPDEEFVDTNDDGSVADETTKPDGKDLTIDSFKIAPSKIEDENELIISQYEMADEYKLASKKATERINLEELIKADAYPAMEVDDVIYIKEGTVIGRTFTDREVVEDLREDEELEDYKISMTKTEAELKSEDYVFQDKLIGNYLRIIMQEAANVTPVEDVENYMKLDVVTQSPPNDWELFFWLPFESGGTDEDGCGPESQGTCSTGETAVGIIQWTVLTGKNMNNIAGQFIPGCLEANSSLCGPLKAYESWSAQNFWDDWNSGTREFQKVLSQICDADRDGFLSVQMEVAKEQYLTPLLKSYPWLEERPSCVQGAVMHLRVWGASTDWLSDYESSSDEEIVLKVRNTIANTSSTAGEATGDEESGRAYNEPQIALEILSGAATTEDIEKWVRTRDTSVFQFDFK